MNLICQCGDIMDLQISISLDHCKLQIRYELIICNCSSSAFCFAQFILFHWFYFIAHNYIISIATMQQMGNHCHQQSIAAMATKEMIGMVTGELEGGGDGRLEGEFAQCSCTCAFTLLKVVLFSRHKFWILNIFHGKTNSAYKWLM